MTLKDEVAITLRNVGTYLPSDTP